MVKSKLKTYMVSGETTIVYKTMMIDAKNERDAIEEYDAMIENYELDSDEFLEIEANPLDGVKK